MPWETSDRRSRLPRDWTTRRARILRRDNNRCQWPQANGSRCGARANQVDHRTPGDDHSESNLWALCEAHHKAKTAREAAEGRARARAAGRIPPPRSSRREPERHPGAYT